MAGYEVPGAGKDKPRPMLNVKTHSDFNNIIKSNFGEAPKRGRLSEFIAGHITKHVYDSEFNSMTGNGDYV